MHHSFIHFASERETPTHAYSIRSVAKITVHAFSALIHHCASLVKSDRTILMSRDGLRWCKLLVKLAPRVKIFDGLKLKLCEQQIDMYL